MKVAVPHSNKILLLYPGNWSRSWLKTLYCGAVGVLQAVTGNPGSENNGNRNLESLGGLDWSSSWFCRIRHGISAMVNDSNKKRHPGKMQGQNSQELVYFKAVSSRKTERTPYFSFFPFFFSFFNFYGTFMENRHDTNLWENGSIHTESLTI